MVCALNVMLSLATTTTTITTTFGHRVEIADLQFESERSEEREIS